MLSGLALLLAPGTWHPAPALALLCILFCSSLVTRHSSLLFGQQPQAQQGQPLYAVNAKQVNGLAPGYWPTPGTGLTLNLSTGTALCGSPPTAVTYAGGTLTMRAVATNFVYLDPAGSCVPASNTSGFNSGQIPIAVVLTNASTITAVNDVRSSFSPPITLDSTGRSIIKGLNDAYFADQYGDKSTTGIASAISACGTSTPCRVVVPGSYPTTERVPGSYVNGYWQNHPNFNPGTTGSNIQIQDFRLGDYQIAFNQQGGSIGHRPWHQWVDNIYAPPPRGINAVANSLFNPVMNVLDGGRMLSGAGYIAKSSAFSIESVCNQYTPGDCGAAFYTNQYSVGDSHPLYAINNFYGGQSTQGEEGAEGVDIWVMQGHTAYQGTIASGGLVGATSLTLSPTAGAGTQGAGRYLINTTSGKTISAGTISNITNNLGRTPITFTGSGTSWPVSTVNTTTTQAITSPGSHTVTVGSSSGITTSTVLVICDGSAYETVIPTAVGSGTITANFAAPHTSGAIVSSGGLSGYFLELTGDTVPSGRSTASGSTTATALRQVWPVLYSTSSTSLVASIDEQGTWVAFIPGVNTAWTNASGSNGYVLYPGSTVTSVYSSGAVGNTFSLMPNAVNWQDGDTVELPQHPADYATLGTWNVQTWWPAFGATGGRIAFFGVPGYETTGMRIGNYAPTTLYSGGGGNLQPPFAALREVGPWQVALDIQGYGPSISGMVFEGQKWGTAGSVYPIVVVPSSGRSDHLAYSSSSKLWTLSVNSQGASYTLGANVSGGGFEAPGHIGSSTTDTQGTVMITSSTSATVNFSVPFLAYPICTLTPTSDPTSVGGYWVSGTTHSAFTVNLHRSGTITFNYICMGNPN